MEAFEHQPYQIALVALDLTEMDDHVIQYVSVISKILHLNRIYFLHVAKDLELPEELLKKYPSLMAPLDESLELEMRQQVNKYMEDTVDVSLEFVVKEGAPIEKILKFAKVKEVDLIFMGRKRSLKGSGLVSSHIARTCPSSLLLVPEQFNSQVKQILVPVDFSNHAYLALKQAEELTKEKGRQVRLVHLFTVSSGYSKIGKSYEEFEEIIEGHAQNDCQKFLNKYQFAKDLECAYINSRDGSKAELIHNHAVSCKADMIVIGSKGRTLASAILIGSLAERLVFYESDIPVLVVKKKHENMSFIEAIFRI